MAEAQQHPEIRADDIVDDQNMETVETQMMESAVASSLSCSFREAYLEWTEDSTGEWKAKMGLPSNTKELDERWTKEQNLQEAHAQSKTIPELSKPNFLPDGKKAKLMKENKKYFMQCSINKGAVICSEMKWNATINDYMPELNTQYQFIDEARYLSMSRDLMRASYRAHQETGNEFPRICNGYQGVSLRACETFNRVYQPFNETDILGPIMISLMWQFLALIALCVAFQFGRRAGVRSERKRTLRKLVKIHPSDRSAEISRLARAQGLTSMDDEDQFEKYSDAISEKEALAGVGP